MNKPRTSNIHYLSARERPTVKDLLRFVVVVRRNIRKAAATLDHQRDKVRHYHRQARILKALARPFDGARIAALETLADDAATACKPLRATLNASGQLLSDLAPMIDAGTTLAQRCEILNVNTADRACLTEADGLHMIVFAHGLEDSAARRRRDWNDGPLFQASHQVFIDFMLRTREGRALGNSMFQPGGLLGGLPMYVQAADGAMQRQPPKLYVVAGTDKGAPTGAGL